MFVPLNQWVNIQFGANYYNGYELKTYDLVGRLTASASDPSQLQPQIVVDKSVSMLRNFQGMAQSLLFYQERKALPLSAVNITSGQNYLFDNECIAYMVF